MESGLSLAFALIVGFGHAFEADHLLAISTLVSKSKNHQQVLYNGFIWGLGHTSTIFLMGMLLILFQVQTLKLYFDYFEIFVGLMLILLGIIRIVKRTQEEMQEVPKHQHSGEAYGIGLVHGLAGSGALILLVMADLETSWEAIAYLLIFGLGSAIGMSVAATVLRLPLLKGKLLDQRKNIFNWIASGLCIAYGIHILLRFV
jgi:cytochrome c biogenesis protein CcdA